MQRIGEILSRSVPLSSHDLEEILQEQKSTRQRFGEAALALGKAKPQQVWDAWLIQIGQGGVDLNRWPTDALAVSALPADLAMAYELVPLRVRGTVLVVAAAADLTDAAVRHVERRCGVTLVVVKADPMRVAAKVAGLYPSTQSDALPA